jgi:hypothetical protein
LNAYVHKMLGNYYILLLAGKKCWCESQIFAPFRPLFYSLKFAFIIICNFSAENSHFAALFRRSKNFRAIFCGQKRCWKWPPAGVFFRYMNKKIICFWNCNKLSSLFTGLELPCSWWQILFVLHGYKAVLWYWKRFLWDRWHDL